MKNGSFTTGVSRWKETWPSSCLTIVHHQQSDLNLSFKSREDLRSLPISVFLTTGLPSGFTFQNILVESLGKMIQPFSHVRISACPQKVFIFWGFFVLHRDDLQLVPGNDTSLLAPGLNQRLQKAQSRVTTEPLSKRELAFYSYERDLSPNINNARYVQVKIWIVCKGGWNRT